MDWTQIPSLSALRAFEAAARLGSFSAAARTLNVTPAAIAQHVRTLEQELGQPLMIRQGAGMGVTAEGQALSESLRTGFGSIATGVARAREAGRQRPINVSLTPTFAENWLMPRLPEFWKRHPDINLNLSTTEDVVDLAADGIDLAVRYGEGHWPGLYAEKVTNAGYSVVGAPEVLEGVEDGDLAALKGLTWLQQTGNPSRDNWIEVSGIDLSHLPIRYFSTNPMVLSATRAGAGVSVQAPSAVQHDIEMGSLRSILTMADPWRAYYLVTRTKVRPPRLEAFCRWLLETSNDC